MAKVRYKGFRLVGDSFDGTLHNVRVNVLAPNGRVHFETVEAAKAAIDKLTAGIQYVEVPKPKKPGVKKPKPEPVVKPVNTHRHIQL
jgi:hypothetical protein